MNQLLNQAPAGFLPRVFYGISRGPETYRFIKDTVFTINNLTGNVGDAYELLSPNETGSYIEAVATQINSNQIKITIQGDYQFNTENFTLINLRNGVAVIANLPNSLVLQEASFLGSYNPQDNKEKQITVLYDLESGNDNVVFASVDYNSDDVYNWVRIGGYINGLNGYSIWAVTASTIEAVLASAKDNDILVAGESFNYEETDFMTGDVDLIVTLEPLVITNRGNIKGETGATGATGAAGAPGLNGQTPYIQNDYWYIGGVNTGVKAVGTDGTDGQDGQSFQIQSGLYSVPSNVGQPGNVDYDGNTLSVLPTLPDSTVSGKGYVVYDPLTTPLEPFYDLYYANAGDTSWTIIHPFSGIKGQDGRNGYTPYIQNGSWYINGVNQGVPATGPQGAQGEGILSIENTGYTQGQGFTTTHITATLTDGTEEHFDVTATDGATGATGAPGPTGATPNISVTATALPAGSAPTATRSGSNENPIINFGIPDLSTNPTIIAGQNVESINGLSYSNLREFVSYFNERLNKTFWSRIGAQESSNFKNLVGNPSGFGNYTSCFIRCITRAEYTENPYFYSVYECIAVGDIDNKLAIGYIFNGGNAANSTVFSGWKVQY